MNKFFFFFSLPKKKKILSLKRKKRMYFCNSRFNTIKELLLVRLKDWLMVKLSYQSWPYSYLTGIFVENIHCYCIPLILGFWFFISYPFVGFWIFNWLHNVPLLSFLNRSMNSILQFSVILTFCIIKVLGIKLLTHQLCYF